MRATVVILVKLPDRLPVKTRLWPVLGREGAAAFFAACVEETIALARRLTPDVVVAYSPADARPPTPLHRPVAGTDGATCLENALAGAWARFGDQPLVALGGDAPDLPLARLEQAVALLAPDPATGAGPRADAVLVPTGDGGFSALALRRPVPGLARGFSYGGADALASLKAFLERERGLRCAELEPWPDIDTPESLERYRKRRGKA